ncbi:putative transposable element [Colletotrichum incanum]|uniref:Putative transposable element n=1 Tax=Colletotrichum incanum TaxID=1573173 RepID=A0A161VXE7_COLIC|nr:putative transposable element [Colletotrichum incanum]
MRKFRNSYRLPLFQVAEALKDIPMERVETINPLTLLLWEDRLEVIIGEEETRAIGTASTVRVAVSSSVRREIKRSVLRDDPELQPFSFTLGPRTEQNPYSVELAAIAYTLRRSLRGVADERITVVTSNKGAVLSLKRPYQQSGQAYICSVYDSVEELRKDNNIITVQWLAASEEDKLLKSDHSGIAQDRNGKIELLFASNRRNALTHMCLRPGGRDS